MKKYIVIFLTLLFSLIALTKSAQACEQNEPIHTSSCYNQQHPTEKHNCCQSEKSPKHDHKEHADGKCNKCSCQQISSKLQLFFGTEKISDLSHILIEKSIYSNYNCQAVSGFVSIWLLPKIG